MILWIVSLLTLLQGSFGLEPFECKGGDICNRYQNEQYCDSIYRLCVDCDKDSCSNCLYAKNCTNFCQAQRNKEVNETVEALLNEARATTCGPPPRLRHGDWNVSTQTPTSYYTTGDAVTFTCHNGYTLEGSRSCVCTEGSTWEPVDKAFGTTLPACNKIVPDCNETTWMILFFVVLALFLVIMIVVVIVYVYRSRCWEQIVRRDTGSDRKVSSTLLTLGSPTACTNGRVDSTTLLSAENTQTPISNGSTSYQIPPQQPYESPKNERTPRSAESKCPHQSNSSTNVQVVIQNYNTNSNSPSVSCDPNISLNNTGNHSTAPVIACEPPPTAHGQEQNHNNAGQVSDPDQSGEESMSDTTEVPMSQEETKYPHQVVPDGKEISLNSVYGPTCKGTCPTAPQAEDVEDLSPYGNDTTPQDHNAHTPTGVKVMPAMVTIEGTVDTDYDHDDNDGGESARLLPEPNVEQNATQTKQL